VIVVVGQPALMESEHGPELAGLPARIAAAAAAQGGSVQLVGAAGEDAAGDEVVLALARAGVGHVALIRKAGHVTPVRAASDPFGDDLDNEAPPPAAPPLDPGDVDLALRYLPEADVIVVAEPGSPGIFGVAAQAAGWFDARLIVLAHEGAAELSGLPADSIVFEPPADDRGGAFATMVAAFAVALDSGEAPAEAFERSVAGASWASASASPTPD